MPMRAVLLALLLAVLAAPSAQAADPDGFAVTFPRASALCAKADAGKLARGLKPDAAKVKAACRKLRSAYARALAAHRAVAEPLAAQARAALQQSREDCRAARANRDNAACRAAQQAARERIRALRAQIAASYKTFQAKNETARKAFWAAIRKLRGGKSLRADAAPGTAPSVDAPDETAADGA